MRLVRAALVSAVAASLAAFATAEASASGSCEALAALTLPHGRITSAEGIAPGAFVPPAARPSRGGGGPYRGLPAFCRVAATLTPSSDSDIRIEVWLPASGWNHEFQAVGNGAWAGTISYGGLAQALAGGYASASTDTGHTGNSAAFALGHPEKVIDMGYRAVHEMTVAAKTIVAAYYGTRPRTSFWNGCSTGGRQGITEAQRYPDDYDAIVAGAPAVNWMRLHAERVALNRLANESAAAEIPAAKYAALHAAALAACDGKDGVKDGVIEDPMHCRFDPSTLLCKNGDLSTSSGSTCLTRAQVDTARALYAPLVDPATGARLAPPLLEPGSELNWGRLVGPEPVTTALEAFKYVVFANPRWDPRTFDASTDFARAIAEDRGVLDSGSTNLTPYFRRGGKLLMYHGWADGQVPPLNSIDYFKAVVAKAGRSSVGSSIQLYMIPGMAHCQGGPGTDVFDKMAAMEQWVKTGAAPSEIVAAHFTDGLVDRTRPICPIGERAQYAGTGSIDDARNFACRADSGRVAAAAIRQPSAHQPSAISQRR